MTRVSASGACALVREAEIAPYAIPPGVIVWGSRLFVRDEVEPHEHAYVEAFAHFLVDPAARAPGASDPEGDGA